MIFTFDGDEAGQKAALRAFEGDQQFVGQTYVAVEPDGLDPCDLRLAEGDAAVRELVARRVPLYRFVLGNVVSRYDLDRADGRVDAMREAAQLVSEIRDRSKVDAFARELAGMLGIDIEEARAEVRRAVPALARSAARRSRPRRLPRPAAEQRLARLARPPVRSSSGRRSSSSSSSRPWSPGSRRPGRERLHPPDVPRGVGHRGRVGRPRHRRLPGGLGGHAADVAGVQGEDDLGALRAFNGLAVEPLLANGDPTPSYAAAHVFRLQEVTALRRIAEVKSRLQRTNPVEHAAEYNRMFGELVALESHRRRLRERAIGATD